mgnify:CR=1 FL=1
MKKFLKTNKNKKVSKITTNTFKLFFLFFGLLCTSCEYDNYEAPGLVFSGNLTYNGNSFYFDGNPNRNVLLLIQKGFGKVDIGTAVRIDENGKFNQLLFPGEYWLTLSNNPYPFEFKDFKSLGAGLGYDSIHFTLNKNLTQNFEMLPYYEIKNLKTSISDGNINVTFDVAKVEGTLNPAPKIVRARCFVSTSSLVTSSTLCTKSKIVSITNNATVTLSVSIADGANSYRNIYINNFRNYAFLRVALELNGIPDYYLFSETVKVENLPD